MTCLYSIIFTVSLASLPPVFPISTPPRPFQVLDCVLFHFFFQAEDGIRDIGVTGVQTCALPIWLASKPSCSSTSQKSFTIRRLGESTKSECVTAKAGAPVTRARLGRVLATGAGISLRSEERRVGKECRSRRSPDH